MAHQLPELPIPKSTGGFYRPEGLPCTHVAKLLFSQVLQRLQGKAALSAGQERGGRQEAVGDQREADRPENRLTHHLVRFSSLCKMCKKVPEKRSLTHSPNQYSFCNAVQWSTDLRRNKISICLPSTPQVATIWSNTPIYLPPPCDVSSFVGRGFNCGCTLVCIFFVLGCAKFAPAVRGCQEMIFIQPLFESIVHCRVLQGRDSKRA